MPKSTRSGYSNKNVAKVEVPAEESATEGEELESLTVAELKERADELGLGVPSRLTKGELIDAIEEAAEDEENA